MTLADAFAVGSDITGPDGTVYKLRKPTLYEQGEFQRWLEQRAHDAVDRSTAPEDAKDRRHARIDTDAALGKYEFDGPYAMEALWTPAGLAKVVAIVCRDQGVTDELAERLVADQIKRIAAALLARASDDPKALAPLLGALGLPTDWLRSGPNEPSSSSSSTPRSTEPSPSSPDSPTTSSCSSTPSSAAPMG
ncbi:hypothetical protein R5W23_005499 [Gemmata sp. JC673]|uniref:Uncharacterized protein n=1 Tax=Gemmata algarum TaxID=2975278 RepID=A0ABU5ETJ6_9BACT|nr:hypothetical protein [Gemmata algarum]MDY3558406.1 hypothetical protein [Gemmata algarum]